MRTSKDGSGGVYEAQSSGDMIRIVVLLCYYQIAVLNTDSVVSNQVDEIMRKHSLLNIK